MVGPTYHTSSSPLPSSLSSRVGTTGMGGGFVARARRRVPPGIPHPHARGRRRPRALPRPGDARSRRVEIGGGGGGGVGAAVRGEGDRVRRLTGGGRGRSSTGGGEAWGDLRRRPRRRREVETAGSSIPSRELRPRPRHRPTPSLPCPQLASGPALLTAPHTERGGEPLVACPRYSCRRSPWSPSWAEPRALAAPATSHWVADSDSATERRERASAARRPGDLRLRRRPPKWAPSPPPVAWASFASPARRPSACASSFAARSRPSAHARVRERGLGL